MECGARRVPPYCFLGFSDTKAVRTECDGSLLSQGFYSLGASPPLYHRTPVECLSPGKEDNSHTGGSLQGEYETVGGFIFEQLARVPRKGESFQYENCQVTVLEATERAVTRVRIKVIQTHGRKHKWKNRKKE